MFRNSGLFCCAVCCELKDSASRKKTANLVMEILSTFQETRGWFQKEITKARDELGRHLALLSHQLRSCCSQGRSEKDASSLCATVHLRFRDVGKREEGGAGLCSWPSFPGVLEK